MWGGQSWLPPAFQPALFALGAASGSAQPVSTTPATSEARSIGCVG